MGQPILLLLGFRYLLGGAIDVPGGDYVQYLLPGLFTAAVIISSGGTAISLAQDLKSGIVDRFRTLPIARSAMLAARTTADQIVNLVSLAAIVALKAFVPVESFPQWLQPIARVQPVTITVDAVRALTNGLPAGDLPWQSALWSVVILVVAVAIAVRQYRRGSR